MHYKNHVRDEILYMPGMTLTLFTVKQLKPANYIFIFYLLYIVLNYLTFSYFVIDAEHFIFLI